MWFSLNGEGDPDTRYNMHEPWGPYDQWTNPDTEGHTLADFTHRRSLEESDPQRQEVGGGARDGEGERESMFHGGRVSIWEDEKALEMVVVVAARQYECF